jgi:hypothetical protein
MRWEFEQRLFERWPTWFSPKGDIPQTGMTLVFRHDDGWFNILRRQCGGLEPRVCHPAKKPW